MPDQKTLYILLAAESLLILVGVLFAWKNKAKRSKILSYVGMALAIINFIFMMGLKFME